MNGFAPLPPEAAVAINDLLDHCAKIQAGQHVLIVAAPDGLHGGRNIVDASTVAWIQAGVQLRGAHPSVLWVDMPIRREVVWPDIPTPETVWRIPPILKHALRGADVFISHVLDLSHEEELKELSATLVEYKVPMVRNMASTTALLSSEWARTPHELVSEIRFRVAEQITPGAPWKLTHPNGTHLEGMVEQPARAGAGYANWRTRAYYWPFPEGIYPAVNPTGAAGIYVFDRMMPVWAGHIGVPAHFREPVRLTVENNHIVSIAGGSEAETLRGFLAALARRVGAEAAYEVRGPHGGIHPCAHVPPALCPDEGYRQFIASFHPSSIHIHLGQASGCADFPFNLHTAAEIRGATLTVGDQTLHDAGRLTATNHPSVRAVAARYPGRPGCDFESL